MKYALFMGCKIPFYLEHYGVSSKAVLHALGVKTVELNFNCCGYPNRDIDFKSFVFSSARNIALAEKKGLDLITPCQCCFGTLKQAVWFLKQNEELRNDINAELGKERLKYEGSVAVKHTLTVLAKDIGLQAIKGKIRKPVPGLKVAAHYGCHALRPGEITGFDNPNSPRIFEELIELTGAAAVDWPRRLDCCGNPLLGKNDEMSHNLMKTKLLDARDSGAHVVCTACTYCQIQFDAVQKREMANKDNRTQMPAILYTQLLGRCMGLPENKLGIKKNNIPFEFI